MESWLRGGGGDSPDTNRIVGYALKADIKSYFQSVDQRILLSIVRRRIPDEDALWLIQTILSNQKTAAPGKGMPLGNLTSQFLANVYLAELDQFVKHELRAKYYIRYVDDFVILSRSRSDLAQHQKAIELFLSDHLRLSLHPDKTKIIPLRLGLTLLGLRVFYHFRLLKKSNQLRIYKRIAKFKQKLGRGTITRERIRLSFAGWEGYAKMAESYKLRTALRKEMECMINE
jgi:RNA-directed DNA polymerase